MYIVQSIHIWERVQDEKKQEQQKCPAETRQRDGKNWGLVWRNRKKISQIIKDYFHLPFFLLIILWGRYNNLIPARFLAPIDSLKIPAEMRKVYCIIGK
jgi:hypothetical protein